MERTAGNKKRVPVLLLAAVCIITLAAIIFWKQAVEKRAAKIELAEEYMAGVGKYTLEYDKLPVEVAEWSEGYMPELPKVTDTSLLPENRLGTLINSYNCLGQIHVTEPENSKCRELFEQLKPYYQDAFFGTPDMDTEECLAVLETAPSPETMAEIDKLAQQVWDLYESSGASYWWTVCTAVNMQIKP